jgi:hypothetical protein
MRIVIVAVVAFLSVAACGGGDDGVCQDAIGKFNECKRKATAPGDPVPKWAWDGECKDGVTMKSGTQKDYTVDLKSWSEAYVKCSSDPMTCLCPGQPFIIPDMLLP